MTQNDDEDYAEVVPPPVTLTVTVPADVHECLAAVVRASRGEFVSVEAMASQAVEAVARGVMAGHGVNLLALGRKVYGIANMGKPATPTDLAEFVLGRLARIPEEVAFEVFLQEVADNPWEQPSLPNDGEIPF